MVDVRETAGVKRIAIIQARTGSTRLPRKVLADVLGASMLSRVISRVRQARAIDGIVVATTTHDDDEPVAALAETLGVGVFRGSEHDVLGRYRGAAAVAEADVVVRVTADCPLLDPAVIDRVVEELCARSADVDYASNVVQRTYPRGLDVEALFRDTLERLHRRARTAAAREHVTYYLLREQPALFAIHSVVDSADNSDLRWTVDQPEDLELVRLMYRTLNLGAVIRPFADVVAWARRHPEACAMNAHVEQKA